ncbi:hypothetical protein ApAK_01230 [Thermoplasmatales archaeon AK]|nr:hypothetical protein [Thermoplasmatales archaeon AK]
MFPLILDFTSPEGRSELTAERCFLASRNPPYIGILTLPSEPIWRTLSSNRTFSSGGFNWSIRYRIEVGESTIFFATSQDKDAEKIAPSDHSEHSI